MTKYHLVGDKVTYETNGTDKIYYTYDSSNDLVSMNLNGTEYFYIRNAQGDIIGLVDGSGTQVVSYSYDTWGKLKATTGSLASTVGAKNPYLYRGYRYNSEWVRFINADALVGETGELLSNNMFAYCNNDPVNMEDDLGYFGIKLFFNKVYDSLFTFVLYKSIQMQQADWHTYFVSDKNVLVYNMCEKPIQKLKMTTLETTKAAKKLGFEKIKQTSHGQAVYRKGNLYITPDVDTHNGGVWKMVKSLKRLKSNKTSVERMMQT